MIRKFILGFFIGMFLNIFGGFFLIGKDDENLISGYLWGLLFGMVFMFMALLFSKRLEISKQTNLQ